MRMLDLFCGRWGWSKAFAAREWECEGFDLVAAPEIPENCIFRPFDVMLLEADDIRRGRFDFACASPPCEEFSVWGMKHFHPNPKYPENGIRLFNHTRSILEASGVPYVMENVRAAQRFVGNAAHHCGPFYLWGNAVPALMPRGITKGFDHAQTRSASERKRSHPEIIPPELANCVAGYAERILEQARK
jgi:hypothetical protein